MNRGAGRASRLFALLFLLMMLAGVFWAGFPHGTQPAPPAKTQDTQKPPSAAPAAAEPEPVGAAILKDYGSPKRTPEQDLTDMAHALTNFALLVKGPNPLPLGANEEVAAALRGRNKAHLRFLPDQSTVFNQQGQVVDRWGTPLFFHAADAQRIDIRSAGPDRQMWTADDLHRRFDGTFVRGQALNAPSLFEAMRDYKSR